MKLKVTENQINWFIQIDVVKKKFTEEGGGADCTPTPPTP